MDSKFKTKAREDGKQLDLYYPESGVVYSLLEIHDKLYLRDSACLNFTHEGVKCVVQDSHCTREEMMALPLLAESKWSYVRETEEWIPVFRYAGSIPVTEFLDIEVGLDYYSGKRDGSYWVTPKGLPREQQLSDGVVPAPDEVEPEVEVDTNYADDAQRFQVEFVRKFCPLIGIAEAVEKYALYRSYRDEGQTQSVARRYAGL